MNPAQLRFAGVGARQARVDAGLRLLAELQASPDPVAELRKPAALELLGPEPGSPFARGARDNTGLLEDLEPCIAALPDPETGISRPPLSLRVTVIDDELTRGLLTGAATTRGLRAAQVVASASALAATDLVILTPASIGAQHSVPREGSPQDSQKRQRVWADAVLHHVIPACRKSNIPVVFWDHTTRSTTTTGREIAKACDRVFAVSEEAVRRYAATRRRPAEAVRVPMIVNPLLSSPLGSRAPAPRLIGLAEAQLGQRPKDLRLMMGWLLDGIRSHGIPTALFRGGAPDKHPTGTGAGFAVRHWPLLAPNPGPTRLAAVDRVTDIGLALNPVISSQTLYDRRVLELQACGSMVLSTYNQGVNSYLPHVHVPQSATDVADMLGSLSIAELRRAQGDGIRTAFTDHHVTDALGLFCESLGITVDLPTERVLAVAQEPDPVLRAEMAAQTHADLPLTTWDQLPAQHGSYDILLPLSTARHYSPTYAADAVAAFRYQGAPVVSKQEGSAELADPDALRHLPDDSVADWSGLDLSAWWRPRRDVTTGPDALLTEARRHRIYSSDHLGHHPRSEATDARRPCPSLESDDDLAASSHAAAAMAEDLQLKLAVVVPVYNNGDHLRHKAFASLRRSSVFQKMQVLLVNDGSTDPVTVDTIEELAHEYPNVMAYHHAAGGSGSASRPRNTGLQLAQTEFVTYLDPDNEAVDDGFARLLEDLLVHPSVDFALGDMTHWASQFGRLRYSQLLRETLAEDLDETGTITVPADALEKLHFRPMGIQTIVARTDWLKGCGLTQPLGAVGQDSYFFQQMLYYARRIRVQDIGVHTYYSAVSDSTVNTINPGYFEKYRPLDAARADWLREIGKLESYRSLRLEPFFVSWMLPKLRRLESEPASWLFAAETLADLLGYYGEHSWTSPEAVRFWRQLSHARRRRKPRG